MPLVIAGVALLVIICAMAYLMAKDRGPSAADTAMSYEYAWDRLDFQSLWALSAVELRDNLDRSEFIRTKEKAYADRPQLKRLARGVTIVSSTSTRDVATVVTEIALNDGHTVRDDVQMSRRDGRWQVVRYSLAREGEPAPDA